MKRLQRAGLGRKAEPLTAEEGSGSPQALLDAMVIMNGIYFAWRSGSEHRQLRCQIEVIKNQESVPTLCTQKTFQRINLEASKVEN